MDKFENIIHALKNDSEVPESVWSRYTDTLHSLPELNRRVSRRTLPKRRIMPFAAAIAIAIGTISVGAAGLLHWSSSLNSAFTATEAQKQTITDMGMSEFTGKSVTDSGVTVTAQQSIVDDHFAYITLKVEGYVPQDDKQPDFSDVRIEIDGQEAQVSYSMGFYDGLMHTSDGAVYASDGTPFTEKVPLKYTLEDGSLEYLIFMQSSEDGYFIGREINLELNGLGIYNEKAGSVITDNDGSWNLSWNLSGSSSAESIVLAAPLEDSGATVTGADISPISISVKYDMPRETISENYVDDNGVIRTRTSYKRPPQFVGILLKDGTMLINITGGGFAGYISEDSDVYTYTFAFTKVIDVDEAESLLFLKEAPQNGQELCADNLYIVPLR